MTRLQLALVGLLFLGLASFQENKLPKTFTKLLDRGKMTFSKPFGLTEVATIDNDQMNYEYALKYPDKNFEVRYAIRPLDIFMKEYQESIKNKKEGESILHPNKYYSPSLQATVLNISGGQLPNISQFDKEAVKNEFNADWGATTFVTVGEEFGQSYKYCVVVAIHKDDIGDAYIFFLSDTKVDFEKNMQTAFHSLRFN